MFTIKDVRVVSCEEKPWEFNGKKGVWYQTAIRIGQTIFNVSSKVSLQQDTTYDLEFELQDKQPKVGNSYTGVRIIGIIE